MRFETLKDLQNEYEAISVNDIELMAYFERSKELIEKKF